MPKDSEELQPWNHITLTVSNPKLNFLLCRMLLVEMETGRAGKGRGGECSLNLLTFTACCSIKPCGQDWTLTRLSRDDKLAVLPDAWLPDLYSLSSGGGEVRGGGEPDSSKWCLCQWGTLTGNAHFTLSISLHNDGNIIKNHMQDNI